MDGFGKQLEELRAANASVVAASVDDIDNAKKVADGKGFPFGYGVTRDTADTLGSWWEDRRQIVQPSEFVVNGETGKVVLSSYSDGPLGRVDAGDVVKLVNFYESMAKN